MAYRVAIVDGSVTDAEFVQGILNSWAELQQVSIQAQVFSSAEGFLFQYAENRDWDILLLSDGTVLPLPRGAYEPLNRAIIPAYIGRKLNRSTASLTV